MQNTELKTSKRVKHGKWRTPEFSVWQTVMNRCDNGHYKHVPFADVWRDFVVFLADMGPRPGKGYSIDRIDNNKGYGPGNCRWATAKEQARNRRTNVRITIDCQTKTLAEWAEVSGLNYSTVVSRHRRGWSAKKLLDKPAR